MKGERLQHFLPVTDDTSGDTGATSTTLPNYILSFRILMMVLRVLFSQAEVFLNVTKPFSDLLRTVQKHLNVMLCCYVILFPCFSFSLSVTVQFDAGSLDE